MIRKNILIIALVGIFSMPGVSGAGAGEKTTLRKLTVFYSPSCHRCIEAKKELIPDIEKEFKGWIQVQYLDISDIENYKLLLSLEEKTKSAIDKTLPIFYFEGRFLPESKIKEDIRRVIAQAPGPPEENGLPKIDLVAYFKTLKPLAIIGAGLIDGINPCAFTVIVFFVSFLALQGYRKRDLIIIGLTFIFTVFLTYILIGLELFGFIYRLQGFWLLARAVNLSIAISSLILGFFALYDFFKFKRTGRTEGLLLQLPRLLKRQIQAIIGWHYRNTEARQGSTPKRNIARLILSALVTGFLVSILEAVCTGQVYLPTIAFVLKVSHLKLEALTLLLLYNIMFSAPLFIIFILALWGISSEQFSRFLKKHLLALKIIMAVLFFSLGIFLIWRL